MSESQFSATKCMSNTFPHLVRNQVSNVSYVSMIVFRCVYFCSSWPYCCYKECKNNSQKQKSHGGISFHRFPVDSVLRNRWVSIVRQNRKDETWIAFKFCVICSAHFKKEDIYFRGKKEHRCLKKHAMPQLHIELKETTHQESEPSRTRTIDKKFGHQDAGPSREKNTDDDNLDDIKDSDLESIFDSPRKHKMRMNLRRQKIFSDNQKRKVKHLQQKRRSVKVEAKRQYFKKIIQNKGV